MTFHRPLKFFSVLRPSILESRLVGALKFKLKRRRVSIVASENREEVVHVLRFPFPFDFLSFPFATRRGGRWESIIAKKTTRYLRILDDAP